MIPLVPPRCSSGQGQCLLPPPSLPSSLHLLGHYHSSPDGTNLSKLCFQPFCGLWLKSIPSSMAPSPPGCRPGGAAPLRPQDLVHLPNTYPCTKAQGWPLLLHAASSEPPPLDRHQTQPPEALVVLNCATHPCPQPGHALLRVETVLLT